MSRTEFLQAVKALTPAQQNRAKELAKGLKEQGGRNVYARALAYAQEN
jgi:hypothetical protein